MKNKKRLLKGIIILTFAVTVISLIFLPDKVPMHYGVSGKVDRIGSKYEMLIPSAIMILSYFILKSRIAEREENESYILTSGIVTSVILFVLNSFFIFKAFSNKDVESISIGNATTKLIMVLMGVMLIILGNIMPKLRKNSFIGLRTGWSMKNDLTWQKSQRMGGMMFVIEGLAIIVINLIMSGIAAFIVSMVLILLDIPLAYIVSYIIYKKYGIAE